jgi:hypothetical protein
LVDQSASDPIGKLRNQISAIAATNAALTLSPTMTRKCVRRMRFLRTPAMITPYKTTGAPAASVMWSAKEADRNGPAPIVSNKSSAAAINLRAATAPTIPPRAAVPYGKARGTPAMKTIASMAIGRTANPVEDPAAMAAPSATFVAESNA